MLALDTSTQVGSVALYDGVSVRAELTWEASRRHTMELAPHVVALLAQLDASASDLTGLAVALGPGSFTALRIGLSLAKGLALAQGIPIVGIPTLDVAVYPVRHRRNTLYATLHAGRGRVCVAPYRMRRGRWRRAGELDITTWSQLAADAEAGGLVCGEIDALGIEALTASTTKLTIVSPAKRLRRAGYLAELAWERLIQGEQDDPASLQPIYLHTL